MGIGSLAGNGYYNSSTGVYLQTVVVTSTYNNSAIFTGPATGHTAVVNVASNGDAAVLSGKPGIQITNDGQITESGRAGYGVRIITTGGVLNEGQISAPGSLGVGVYLQAGVVTNGSASASIVGYSAGILSFGTLVNNYGVISATEVTTNNGLASRKLPGPRRQSEFWRWRGDPFPSGTGGAGMGNQCLPPPGDHGTGVAGSARLAQPAVRGDPGRRMIGECRTDPFREATI